jgi:hypothetical protein
MKFRITHIGTNAQDSNLYDITFDVGENDNTLIVEDVVATIPKPNVGGRQSLVNYISDKAYYLWEKEHIGEVLGTLYLFDGTTYPEI